MVKTVPWTGGAMFKGAKARAPENALLIEAPHPATLDRRQIVSALRSLRRGDFTIRLPEDIEGADLEIASLFNEVVSLERGFDPRI